ncbi:hypothetical protein CR205_11220 [Alteribacter lacisalsi]|uniref:Uncharacterized protein n=1 Tax=Alteribacter lacisalsi TaxID=2045244 RepID=A0A2W0HD18_9BACI|nr:hypothetical protein [Alteribacter lacisalsi]PYZ99097.1 hypothetical protein CR205_11220 [Alteribacter lacisalsi]
MKISEITSKLDKMLSGKTIQKLSGKPKKCYKYSMTAIFLNICANEQMSDGQTLNFGIAEHILQNPEEYKSDNSLEYFKYMVENSFNNAFYHNPKEYKTVDKVINLFREIVLSTKKHGTCLLEVRKLEDIFDVKRFYQKTHPNIQPHHWIEINLVRGMIPTFPDFFTYSDLVNTWNIYVEKREAFKLGMFSEPNVSKLEIQYSTDNKKLKYEMDALVRTLWIGSITFAESYLYYLFYNIKQSGYTPKTESAKTILQQDRVEDEVVIKRIVIPEFMPEKRKHLNTKLKEYSKFNKVRNKFIHPSAFHNEQEMSDLLPLITTSYNDLATVLESNINFIKEIEDNLPEKFKILFWWDNVKHPDFKGLKKGNMIGVQE